MHVLFKYLLISLFFISSYSFADTAPIDHTTMTMPDAQTFGSEGVITQWQSGSVGISHHAIPALKWPAMTMNFSLPPEISANSLPRRYAGGVHLCQN
jgi:Cu(I)/Ag(I) efflux system periplasmic protein CusF